ncbi:hypothetical protein F4804DRAFT_336348 [Jackrogersella minutella]|nr:hypothetical protein F4804DRAFT_336348 [Jackrogersella minutella]
METVFREACDACHRRKMRCPHEGVGACANCRRTGQICQFSPRDEMGRPRFKPRGSKKTRARSECTSSPRPSPQTATTPTAQPSEEFAILQPSSENAHDEEIYASIEAEQGDRVEGHAYPSPTITNDVGYQVLMQENVSAEQNMSAESYFTSFGTPWMSSYPITPLATPTSTFEYSQLTPPIQHLNFSQRISPSMNGTVELGAQQTNSNPSGGKSDPSMSTDLDGQEKKNRLIEINYHLSQILLSFRTSDDLINHDTSILQHKTLAKTFPLVGSLRDIITWLATSQLRSATDLATPSMLLVTSAVSILAEICEKILGIFEAVLLGGQISLHTYPHMLSDATIIEFYLAQLQKVLAALHGQNRDQSQDLLDKLRTSLLDFVKEFRKGV